MGGESGLRRFDRDVTAQPGADHLIVFLGINEIGHPEADYAPESERVTADELIASQHQLINRVRSLGLKVYAGAITPFKDSPLGFYTPESEAVRQEFNAWLRSTGAYDGVVDFDAAVRDPEQPGRVHPDCDRGDLLHLNDLGNAALADAVPTHWFH